MKRSLNIQRIFLVRRAHINLFSFCEVQHVKHEPCLEYHSAWSLNFSSTAFVWRIECAFKKTSYEKMEK